VKKRRGKRKPPRRRGADEGQYICPACGEVIVIPLDPSGGTEQSYVEDCPICCRPNVIHVEFDDDGEAPRVWAKGE
jgi:hypothetical protein